jgi:hypothetical protein
LLGGLIGDGRPALAAVAAGLAFAGGLAIYLGATRQLLPHDLAYLGMSGPEIEAISDGGLMDFMVHDRVSWGGSLFGVGVLYMWLIAFPLASMKRWAWATITFTGLVGFASFLSHLPTGYLDSWHGLGTLLLIPVFFIGVVRTGSEIRRLPHRQNPPVRVGWGRRLVIATGAGLAVSGLIIMIIGMTVTFVPSDLEFIGLTSDAIARINDRLVSLVAHDRIGFAGGVVVSGALIAVVALYGEGRASREAIAVAGLVGFGSALAVHFSVGYTDFLHLAPNLVGPLALATGLALWTWEESTSAPTIQAPTT